MHLVFFRLAPPRRRAASPFITQLSQSVDANTTNIARHMG
jgi:hypothetical protein